MDRIADAVVIGGGVVGASIAYHLALRGLGRIVLVERSYLGAGSTGRCGAGVRQQWGTILNCLLAQESVRMFQRMDEELGYDRSVEFRQGGYLILAYTEREMAQFMKNVELERSLGIPVELLTPAEAKAVAPLLDPRDVLGATYCPTDGHANPFHVTYAYAHAARRLGAEILTGTEVRGIHVKGGRVEAVSCDTGTIATRVVVDAAGPHSAEIAAMAGVDIPFWAERHQILATEPVEPALRPMIISFSRRVYCQQTPHGSFIMGMSDPAEPRGFSTEASWKFLVEVAREVTRILPRVGELCVVRQWAGLYDMTPDAHPILGRTPVDGLYLACGFSGHGFMLAPVTGRLLAEIICGERPSIDVSGLDLGRFARDELVIEPSVV